MIRKQTRPRAHGRVCSWPQCLPLYDVQSEDNGEATWPRSCKAKSRSSPARATASAAASPRRSPPRAPRQYWWRGGRRCSTKSPPGIKSRGGEALPVPSDLTKEDAVTALFAAVQKTYGRLDVLVNNAGIATHRNTEDITLDYWRDALDINITAPFLCAREAVRMMKAQTPKGGRIINIGSVSAKTPRAGFAALHRDQIRPARHDASAHHGWAQAQYRVVNHPSWRDAVVFHHAPRPEQGRRRRSRRTTTSWRPRMSPKSRC